MDQETAVRDLQTFVECLAAAFAPGTSTSQHNIVQRRGFLSTVASRLQKMYVASWVSAAEYADSLFVLNGLAGVVHDEIEELIDAMGLAVKHGFVPQALSHTHITLLWQLRRGQKALESIFEAAEAFDGSKRYYANDPGTSQLKIFAAGHVFPLNCDGVSH